MERVDQIRVLVCPLGWGLGHASRLIPIINLLQKKECNIVFAGDKPQSQLISNRFPGIRIVNFTSFTVTLSKKKNQLIPLLGLAMRLPYYTIKEHYAVKRIVKENRIDLIISDNRYGLWCKGVKSVFITHQLKVVFPKPFRFMELLGVKFVRYFSNKYDYCLVPDFEDENNLAGVLSHSSTLPNNIRYVGPLSRFKNFKIERSNEEWDLVGIASGPSPQREIFIDLIEKVSNLKNLKTLIIKGSPSEGTKISNKNKIFTVGHLNDNDFADAILSTKYLITRAGYSTIMDLFILGVSGLIVPTPGQTEQEYLAEYTSGKGLFKTCKQSDLYKIDISIAQKRFKPSTNSDNLLERTFLNTIL